MFQNYGLFLISNITLSYSVVLVYTSKQECCKILKLARVTWFYQADTLSSRIEVI